MTAKVGNQQPTAFSAPPEPIAYLKHCEKPDTHILHDTNAVISDKILTDGLMDGDLGDARQLQLVSAPCAQAHLCSRTFL